MGDVLIEAVGVSVANDVEPVAAPVFAVVRRSEQSVDDGGKCVGRLVGNEGVDLVGGRRQTGERERRAADERGPVGDGRRPETAGFELGQDKGIDRVGRVATVGGRDPRHVGTGGGFERPEVPAASRLEGGRDAGRRCTGNRAVGMRRAAGDPFREDGDLVLVERLLWRHGERLVEPADGLHHEALVSRVRSDRGTGPATLRETGERVEPQASLHHRLAMALKAATFEQGSHAFREEGSR